MQIVDSVQLWWPYILHRCLSFREAMTKKKDNQNCQGRDAAVRHPGRRRAQGPLFACVEAAKLSVLAFCIQESVEKGNAGEVAARLIGRHVAVSVARA